MRTIASMLALAALLLTACSPEADESSGAAVPDGWEAHTFDGGTIAAPADWAAVEPIGDAVLTLRETASDDGPPLIASLRLGPRDAAPIDTLHGVIAAELNLQFPDVEPLGGGELDLDGAEQAYAESFRYGSQVDGEEVTLQERFVIAWYGDDRQAQLRIGGPADRIDDARETLDGIVASLRFTGA